MGDRDAALVRRGPAIAATAWCALFAALHVFWAVGGSLGLASSAGQHLADRRPASFVIFGLYGAALLLLAGVGLVILTTGKVGSRRLSVAAAVGTAVVGVVLLIRAIGLEVLLATGAGGVRATVGPLETRWSLALWNPWFALGGALFLWTALRARRASTVDVEVSR